MAHLSGPVSGGFAAGPGITVLEPAQAPWIRPGVVVHAPKAPVDDLLARFALGIRERGFQVAGIVQRDHDSPDLGGNGSGPVELLDLANGKTIFVDRIAAENDAAGMANAARSLRAAMRDDADLVVISRFAAFERAAREMTAALAGGVSAALAGGVSAALGDGIAQGMPVLTSIGGQCIDKWLAFAGPGGAMLSADMESLWQWWGPERLYRDLALGVADDEVRNIACGPRWLMIEGPHGAGLAYLPVNPKELTPRLPQLRRLSLRRLATLSRSWDPLEMAVGIAAINAHYNRLDLDLRPDNGVRAFSEIPGRVVVIGAFPGLNEVLRAPQVIEASPRPGEYPIIAMDTLLPGCAAAVVASSSLINRNLPRVLRLARGARVALIGAATPLTPRLFDYGIEITGGLVVDDASGLAAAIRAGAPPRDFTRFGRYVHLRAQSPP